METLHSKKLSKQSAAAATQSFLDVAEIKSDTVILKSGALRAIIAVSAINYDLKSSEEQDAIISQYQNFLNSLDFPTQILISSRKINMEKYLNYLDEKEKLQKSELLRLQINEYKDFINQLTSVTNIMEKSFYIIVPFSPIENKEGGFFKNLMSTFRPKKEVFAETPEFEAYSGQLQQRVDHIIAGLSGVGLRLVPLKTKELIELIYNAYNPNVFNDASIADIQELDIQ